MPSFVTGLEALDIKQAFRDLELTIEVVFWDVTWQAWAKARNVGWDLGLTPETWVWLDEGEGRLRENGLSGPEAGKDVIYFDSPYRMRVRADLPLDDTMYVTIGSRLFKIEGYKPRDGDRTHANLYLREIWETLPPL